MKIQIAGIFGGQISRWLPTVTILGLAVNLSLGKTGTTETSSPGQSAVGQSQSSRYKLRQQSFIPLAPVEEGLIIIRFKENLKLPSDASRSGIPSFDKTCSEHRVSSIRRAFPYMSSRGKGRAADLGRIYYLRYDSGENPVEVARAFSHDPTVEYAEPKYIHYKAASPNDSLYSDMSQFDRVQAEAAWDIVRGDNGSVVIAIVDDGTDWDHEDLLPNVWTNPNEIPDNHIDDDENGFVDDVHGWNFVNDTNDPTNLLTENRHGTHTAGIAAAATNNNIGVASMSWNATFMPVNTAHPTDTNLILYGYEGIVYAALNGADIISNSWGSHHAYSLFEQDVIEFAYDNGSLVIAAAGNEQTNNDAQPYYPANYDHVLSVGATNSGNDGKASFSNYGVSVDLFAPGVGINSTLPNDNYSGNTWSGTSMSTPMVAALAALVKTLHPGWTVDQVREQVRVTCDNVDDTNPSFAGLLGNGRMNAYRAVTETVMPSIRVAGTLFSVSGDDEDINSGDTVDVSVKVTNYLSSATNVSIKLSTPSNITITKGDAIISFLDTNDTVVVSFGFIVGSMEQRGWMPLYLDISADENYSDRDLIRLPVNPPQTLTHDTGILQTSITSEGNIGWADFSGGLGGVGFVFNGENLLFEGGLMIATDSSHVSDCIRGDDPGIQENDFRPVLGQSLEIVSPGELFYEEGSIILVDSLADDPLGLQISQITYADTAETLNEFVTYLYQLRNPTTSWISNLYVGIFMDWDINTDANDYARFDASRKMGYVQNQSGNSNMFAAIKLLNTNTGISFRAFNNVVELYDGFTNNEKWTALSGGIQTTNLDLTDVSTLIAAGPIEIPSNELFEIGFAIIGAGDLQDLEASADAAQKLWDNGFLNIDNQSFTFPEQLALYPNYPNPFNPFTTISYDLSEQTDVSLVIYDLLGRKVKTVVLAKQDAASYTIIWDGTDNEGQPVSSGLYLYQLRTDNATMTRKMILVR